MTNLEHNDHLHVIKLAQAEDLITERTGSVHPITIKSAIDLSSEQIERIVKAVRQITHEDFTHVFHLVDDAMLMGVSVNTDAFYYELSGQKMLEELALVMHES
ncbi:F0F1 ATP synthase subunit delta [Aerococcaceae bacterium DSM 111020]|nr:F0F1 ATP synthase subunit delta [Aerococcaceae bacterium DSM 111020]